jgi:chromosome segregation ATPase
LQDRPHQQWLDDAQATQNKDEYLRLVEEARAEAAAHREAAASHQDDASKHKSEVSELRRQLEDVKSSHQYAQQESIALAEKHAAAHASLGEQTARAATAEGELARMREAERHATAEAERLNLRLNRTEAELTEASRDFRDEKRKMEEARELQRVTERQKTALEKQQEEAAAALMAVKAQLDETEADAAAAAARAADDAAAAAMAASESKHRETTLEMDLGATRVALSRTEEGLTETKAREASLRTECHELAATLTIANETKELAVEEARRIREQWENFSDTLAQARALVRTPSLSQPPIGGIYAGSLWLLVMPVQFVSFICS